MSKEQNSELPPDFSAWTEDQLRNLPFFELLVLAGNGEATLHPGGINATKKLFQDIALSSDDYVLEIGCGSGKDLCSLVRKYGCKAVGIDHSDFMVKFARHKVQQSGLSSEINIMKGDVTNLDFSDEEFNVIFAQSVLATVPDKSKAATEIARVLKPGGHFGDIEFTWLHEPDNELVSRVEERAGSIDRPLKSEEWVGSLTKVGFKPISTFASSEFGFPMGPLGFIKQEGFLQGMKLTMLAIGRSSRTHLRERAEHAGWMKESGKMGYGIYVFRKA